MRMIVEMWLEFSLGRDKWYQNNQVTPYGVETLHDVDLDKNVKNLSGGDCDTAKS